MYCPRCGGDVFENYIGGCCQCQCVYCGGAVNCWNVGKTGMIKETEAVTSSREAVFLREKYNQSKDNRKRGEENLLKHSEYLQERRQENKNLVASIMNARNRFRWRQPLVIKESSLAEIGEILRRRKEQK